MTIKIELVLTDEDVREVRAFATDPWAPRPRGLIAAALAAIDAEDTLERAWGTAAGMDEYLWGDDDAW